jgi:hypothetical protein
MFVGLNSGSAETTESPVSLPVPVGGTISKFYFRCTTAACGNTSATTVFLRVAGTNTTISCTVPPSGSGCSDLTNTAAVTAGQAITIQNSGGAGANDFKQGVGWIAALN